MKRLGQSQVDGGPTTEGKRATKIAGPRVDRAAHVRQALRLHRSARGHRGLWLFYLEHNLFEEARQARLVMLEHLRGASEQWRSVLGGKR